MKRINILFALLLTAALVAGCGGGVKGSQGEGGKEHPAWSLDAVIYELNTRQFTREGTFEAAGGHLERLRELGVDIVWVMPIQPIGIKERKGELGSYYAIRDYKAVNAEFGTMENFRAFVARAHSLGMHVILDWAANHTSPDAVWVGNPGWHVRDSLGNTVGPYDWTDVAKLDYTSAEMRGAMIEAMGWWITEADIDGFRCDVAGEIPVDFWNDATARLKSLKNDIFMLAEAEKPELEEKAFDAYYGWELHARLNGVAAGTQNADSLRRYFARHDERFPWGIPLLFTSNHDENSWNGTEFERMGDAAQTLAALTYVVPGLPLIYNGQEVGFDRRLAFFVKDSIEWVAPNRFTALYRSLNGLRHSTPALWSGAAGGTMRWMENSSPAQVLSLVREKDKSAVVAIFNLSPRAVEVTLSEGFPKGEFHLFTTDGEASQMTEKPSTLSLAPWEYQLWRR